MKIGLIYLSRGLIFPVGLLTIASVFRKRFPQHQIEIVDTTFDDPLRRATVAHFDLIGISSMTIDYENATRLARSIKARMSTPIIIGGVHISTLPSSLRNCFDIGVMGEGDETLCELVSLYEREHAFKPDDLRKINGLVFRDAAAQLVITTRRAQLSSLDASPKLDYSLVDKKYFNSRASLLWGDFVIQGTIFTSRGCPYKCAFCSTTQFWDKVRFFSVPRVVSDITDLVENHRVNYIQIHDDLFTVSKRRLREFAEAFKKQPWYGKVTFSCSTRANLVDDELCELLVSMNVKMISFGFESGNDRVLKILKCGSVTVEQNRNAIMTGVRHNLMVIGSVMFCVPTETLAEMEETFSFVDFALSAGAYGMGAYVLAPLPSTPMWEIAKSRGKVSDDMNFDLLAPEALDNPLLLDKDVNRDEVMKLFKRYRSRRTQHNRKKLLGMFKTYPAKTFLLCCVSYKELLWHFVRMFKRRTELGGGM